MSDQSRTHNNGHVSVNMLNGSDNGYAWSRARIYKKWKSSARFPFWYVRYQLPNLFIYLYCASYLSHTNPKYVQTLALSGTGISEFLEIQNQFIGQNVQHTLEACQLVRSILFLLAFVHRNIFDPPTPDERQRDIYLPCSSMSQQFSAMDGPCTYGTCSPGLSMNMTPATGPKGCNKDQQARHELIASRLHDALVVFRVIPY